MLKADTMKKRVHLLLILLAFASCRRAIPEMLIQAKNAKEVRAYSVAGMDVLEYKVTTDYPATSILTDISAKLKAKGWKPLDYLYLYPGYKSSHLEGWTMFQDPPKNPERMIYEWSADWQDKDGNIVTYTFRYTDPFEKYTKSVFNVRPGNSTLSVTAIYMDKDVAKNRQIRPKKN